MDWHNSFSTTSRTYGTFFTTYGTHGYGNGYDDRACGDGSGSSGVSLLRWRPFPRALDRGTKEPDGQVLPGHSRGVLQPHRTQTSYSSERSDLAFPMPSEEPSFQVWEWFSGSGRLSLFLALAHVMVGFPVDFRYGWDVGHAPHQVLLKECQETFGPTHIFASPSCTPWSIASAQKDPHARDLDRRRELPTLEFVHDSMMLQHNNNHGFTLEQPFGSDMLKASPISRLLLHAGIKVARLDQCMLGSQDEQQRPIRKATVFVTNRRWQRTLKRCNGHRGHPHGQLQGQYKGCSRTAMAAVYPKRDVSGFVPGLLEDAATGRCHTISSLASASFRPPQRLLHL